MVQGRIISVTGIDTDIGKTIATGLVARGLLEDGVRVITQKPVQTGCDGVSDDILRHRQLMGVELYPEDTVPLTCSYCFSKPCSPHLAARQEGVTIDPQRIISASEQLAQKYQVVLLEGAGGLFVPLNNAMYLIDLFERLKTPVILVSSSRLGSINHTIASLEALKKRNMRLAGVVYNRFGEKDKIIGDDSLEMIQLSIRNNGFTAPIVEMGNAEKYMAHGDCLQFASMCD